MALTKKARGDIHGGGHCHDRAGASPAEVVGSASLAGEEQVLGRVKKLRGSAEAARHDGGSGRKGYGVLTGNDCFVSETRW